MQFRARVAAVTGTVSNSVKISIKLEPLQLDDPDWLFRRLGEYVTIDLSDSSPPVSPLEQAIEDVLAKDH
jgi:hypothetical protein